MKTYKIKTITAGSYGPVSEFALLEDGDINRILELPSIMYALEADDGEIIICDTSFKDAEVSTKVMASTIFPVDVKREKPFEEIMHDNGIDPDKISRIILSHHHWDHAGGVCFFPNAKVYIQKKEWDFAMADDNYGPEFKQELLDFKDRVITIDGPDSTTFEGIEMVPVGAHTVGLQILFVNTAEGKVCIPFDVVGRSDILTKNKTGRSINPEEMKAAIELIKNSGSVRILCSHDEEDVEHTDIP